MPIIRTGGSGPEEPKLSGGLLDGGSPIPPSRDGVSLADLFGALRRHLVLVLITTTVIGALAGASVFLEMPSYRATAVLRLTDSRRKMTRGLDDSPEAPRQGTNLLLSQAQLLTSRALVGAVVDSEGLRLSPVEREFSASLLSQVRVDPAVISDTFYLTFSNDQVTIRNGTRSTRLPYGAPYRVVGISFVVTGRPKIDKGTLVLSPREPTIDRVTKRLRVSPRDETDIVDVAYDDAVPEVAQRVVNALVTRFQNEDIRQAQGESRRRRLFLDEQRREIDAQLAQSEQALAAFRSRQEIFSARDRLQAQQTALMALDIRQGELGADRRIYASLLQRLQDSLAEGKTDELRTLIAVPEVSANPMIGQLYQQLAQYQATRDSLTTGPWRSAAGNPDVTRLDQLIAASERRLVGAVRGQIATIDARLEALGTLRTRNAAALGAMPRAESDEERLARQVESNRTLADRLREEFQKARMAEAVEAGQVAIVDLASLPYRPVPRLRTLRLLFGVLVGLALGGAAALLRDSTNSRVRRRIDLEQEMRIPVLAVIPRIALSPDDHHSLRRLSARLVSRNGADRRAAGGALNGTRAQTAAGFMSPAGSEAFRLLRSSLKWTQRDASAKTLLISSALSEEGKTTTSANLAVVYALEGKRVLLIDCDMRRPRLHKVFRVPQSPGVAQVLRAGLDPATAVRDTSFEGLSFLPAGRETDATTDLIGSDRMRALLAVLSENFDVIIIDTPPVLGVADAVALGPLVDGVLMVVGAGTTDRHAVEQALSQLASAGARVVGAVLNDSHGEVERYGGNDYYGYPSSYAKSKSTA
jgi:capsular exopolysaccharide synthesis family protein